MKRTCFLLVISCAMTMSIVMQAFLFTSMAEADDANPNCSLIVPDNPLTAQGLATPYLLVATNPDNGQCHEANPAQTAFVQGAILDPANGKISIYNPLVIDKGSQPAIQPRVPQLPANAVVGIWFGFNGAQLSLRGPGLATCTNGAAGSVFGQFAFCHARTFFATANTAIQAGKLAIPALGTARDGLPCPTTRDFGIVDQDQSDNVQTQYLATRDGRIAQFSNANIARLRHATVLNNPSDNALLTQFVDPALGCTPPTAPDLANNNAPVSALPLDELQAAAVQKAPVALVPAGDPMVLVNNQRNLGKLNAYRRGVDQPQVATTADASTTAYCRNLLATAPARLKLDRRFTINRRPPDAAVANSLFTFLAQRFTMTYGPNGLNCRNLLGKPDPIKVKMNKDGVAVAVTINGVSMQQAFDTMNGGEMDTRNVNAGGGNGAGGASMVTGFVCPAPRPNSSTGP